MLPNLRTRFLSRECCVIFIQKTSKFRELCRQDILHLLLAGDHESFTILPCAVCMVPGIFLLCYGWSRQDLPSDGWCPSGSVRIYLAMESVRKYLAMVGVCQDLPCDGWSRQTFTLQ